MVEEAIANLPLEREPQKLYAPIRYVLSLGGKRIRPVLMLMAYNLYRDDVKPCLNPALGLVIFHNFTLLHDDFMDKAEVRRGKTCVHLKWDDNTAILSGDNMLVLAFQYMMKCEEAKMPAVMQLFSKTAVEIDEGQQYDIDFETRNDVTEAEYIEMIRLKTSVLLACALQIGAMLAGADQEDVNNLYTFGEKMGLAFQLQDDLLDVYGDPTQFQKKLGGDIVENKKTFLLINAYQRADDAQKAELDRWVNAQAYEPAEKIAAVTHLYTVLGIDQLAQQKIEELFAESLKSLDQVKVSEEKKAELRLFANKLMGRKY